MRGLNGKVTIVTGGATLIGSAVVAAFVDAGAKVVVADIDDAGGAAVASRFAPDVRFVHTDVTSDQDVEACVAAAVDAYGGVDFLINLACSYVDEGFASPRSDWLKSYDVNVVGGVMMLRAVHPRMVARGGGAVVNFASCSARVAQTGRWLYPAAKAATVQLTRSQAVDLAADGIRVNAVTPGWTWSKVMDQLSGGDRAHVDAVAADYHALGRAGDPGEVARAVLFLCSDDASFITGTDLTVDGGYSAMGPEQARPVIHRLMVNAPT